MTHSNGASRTAERQRVYVIGDIHGRDDLLAAMHARILADAADADDVERVVVYLGDYVDRGRRSFEVIDRLIAEPLPGFTMVALRGNHEDMMLDFLEGPPDPLWLMNGGLATIASYGVDIDWNDLALSRLDPLRDAFARAVPDSHRAFLDRLRLLHVNGDYLFVHAGVRPGRPLDRQEPRDLMWIRGPFLATDSDFGKRVVHGHTIVARPEVRANRIGIDTGAFHTGRLTCLVLQGESLRFLST
jgi:serine/threonine protein phosphatase 1